MLHANPGKHGEVPASELMRPEFSGQPING